jgi:DNA-binding response OmpR family regulator
MRSAPKVLVVEDDESIRRMLVLALERELLDVTAAADGDEALLLTSEHEYAVIILDVMMPRLNGIDFLHAFHQARPDSRTIIFVVTAFGDEVFGQIDAKHAHAIVRKPFDVLQLAVTVRAVATAWGSARQNPPLVADPVRLDSIC